MEEVTFQVKEDTYKLRTPNQEDLRSAKKAYNRAFNDAIRSDSPLQAEAKSILAKRGLWDDSKQKELDELREQVINREYVLEINPEGISKTDARAVALELKKLRTKLQELMLPITTFNIHTAEGQADNARFDYLVSACLVYEDGRQYFSGYDDYLNRENDEVAILGSNKFAAIFYGLTDDFQSTLVENKFLKDYKFVDDKYRLIDSKGNLIDEAGNLVNEDGNKIDADGDMVDNFGHKIDAEGNFVGKKKPFVD